MKQVSKAILFVLLLTLVGGIAGGARQQSNGVTFAVIGDSGDGSKEQNAVSRQMVAQREKTPFDFVIMLGDNIYNGGKPKYFVPKFELPYKPLLDAGVKFYAALGNHDAPEAAAHLKYQNFNMGGRYYTFTKGDGRLEFFVIDSNELPALSAKQLAWLEEKLAASQAKWKIAYFHHPLFSSAKMHSPLLPLRKQLHPLFVKHKVDVVFTGHSHAYERVKPQDGVQYIVEGCSGKIMKKTLDRRSPLMEFGNDELQSFLLVQAGASEMKIDAIDLNGKFFDSVTLKH